MRKLYYIIAIIVISNLLYGSGGFGQDKVVGARQISLGGAFTGVADDIGSNYYNQAGLVNIESMVFSAFYSKFNTGMDEVDVNYSVLDFGYNFGEKYGALALSWIYEGYGDNNDVEDVFSVSSHNIQLGYGYLLNPLFKLNRRSLISNISAGIGISFIGYGADMDDVSDYYYWDIGFTYSMLIKMYDDKLGFGLQFNNLPYIYFDHPGDEPDEEMFGYRVGSSYRYNDNNMDDLFSIDFVEESEFRSLAVGTEKSFELSFSERLDDKVIHRLGYKRGFDEKFHEYSLGLGYKFTSSDGFDMRFDYNLTYIDGDLGGEPLSHMFQIIFRGK